MLSSLDELGRAGYTAIADSPDVADALYTHVHETLMSAPVPATSSHCPVLAAAA